MEKLHNGNEEVDEEVSKILDRFLVSETLLGMGSKFKASVGVGGILNHRPISLQWLTFFYSPLAPLKISQVWLEEEDFKKLVASSWENLSPQKPDPIMKQFGFFHNRQIHDAVVITQEVFHLVKK
jgi:hypothetical protein